MLTSTTYRRAQKGLALLWFVMLSVPTLMLTLGMGVDLGRLVIAHRQAANLASAAAVAGSFQFVPGEAALDTDAAEKEALRTWEWGRTSKNAARNLDTGETVEVTAEGNRVSVTVYYNVNNLLILRYFTDGGKDTVEQATVTRTAFVCVSDVEDDTEGFCARPVS
jgi:uncharacterized membrane protein